MPRAISVMCVGLFGLTIYAAAFTAIKGGAAGLALFAALGVLQLVTAGLFWGLEE